MFVQILTQAMSHIQLITAILLLVAVALELVHIGQTRRINKTLRNAGRWLQRYLNTVFYEEADDEPVEEEAAESGAAPKTEEESVQVDVQLLKSRQEEDMRVSLANKKQKKDEELIDTVLQEIFD